MSGNSGAWGVVMWKDGREDGQAGGISIEGGDPIVPYLPTEPVACLTVPPEGLGVPPVRAGDVAFAQRDGVIQFGDYYEPRILTFQAVICNDGCPGCPTGRQKAKRLTQEWSRNCNGAQLVLFSDCHQENTTQEEKTYLGPYLVHGRPRVADVTWMRSNLGCARVLLRFDCEDARLRLVIDPDTTDEWTSTHSVVVGANDPPEQVEVVGDLCVFPTFTLTADMTAPIVVDYGDSQFTYNADILTDPVVVDTRWGRAATNGVDMTQQLFGNYTSPLPPGVHDVSVTTDDPGDTGTMQVQWDNAVVSA